MDQSTMDTLNSLYKQSSQLTEELDSFNKSIEEQKHESDEAWTEWLDAERNIDYIKQNLTKGDYGFATDSVAEAILASKLSIEMELEKVNAQIHEIYDKNPIVMESPIAGEMNVPEIKEEPVKMDSTEKTFERDSISISYKTTTPITSSGSDDNYSVPAKYDYIQKAGTNDCWAMTISLLFKVLGVKISIDEIKKYRPTNISDKTLNDLNEALRNLNYFSLDQIAYAIVETNGKIFIGDFKNNLRSRKGLQMLFLWRLRSFLDQSQRSFRHA